MSRRISKKLFPILVVFIFVNLTFSVAGAQDCSDTINITESEGLYTITLRNIPEDIGALGFNVSYDSSELTYQGFTNGDCLTADFSMFFVNNRGDSTPGEGVIQVGGVTVDPIVRGSTGCIVHLQFEKNIQNSVPEQLNLRRR